MTHYNTCTICNEVKPVDEFIKDKRIKRGYRNQCKACETKRVAKSLGQTYGQRGSINRIHSKNLVEPEYVERFDYFRRKMVEASSRTKRNGKDAPEFDLMEYWQKLKDQDFKCALTGYDLEFTTGSPWQLSVDCIEPEKGYVLENVQFTGWAANRAKGDLNTEDFKRLVLGLAAYL